MDFNQRILARMATGIENRDPHALAILDSLQPGHARIVGITGPPGAGKSSLTAALVTAIRARNQTVAVIAVDPTSRISWRGALIATASTPGQHHADALGSSSAPWPRAANAAESRAPRPISSASWTPKAATTS